MYSADSFHALSIGIFTSTENCNACTVYSCCHGIPESEKIGCPLLDKGIFESMLYALETKKTNYQKQVLQTHMQTHLHTLCPCGMIFILICINFKFSMHGDLTISDKSEPHI